MSKLILNDNLKAYHAELAEHIKLLQRNTAYILNDIVNYDGITLKCTIAGITNTTKPNISSLSVGSTYTDGTCVWTRIDPDKRGIDYWAASTTYVLNDQVVNDNKIYKCSTAHTSTSTFDNTKWTEISAGGGGSIDEWTSGKSYNSGDIVIKDNTLYVANTTTSTTWDSTEWDVVNDTTLVGGTYYSQKALTGITAPYNTTMIVADTNLCKSPVEVMKHESGSSSSSTSLEDYNNDARYDYDNTKIKFSNGSASLINPKYIKTSAPEDIGGINVTTSEEIDFSNYSKVQNIIKISTSSQEYTEVYS